MSDLKWANPRRGIRIVGSHKAADSEDLIVLHFDLASRRYIMGFNAEEIKDALREAGFLE